MAPVTAIFIKSNISIISKIHGNSNQSLVTRLLATPNKSIENVSGCFRLHVVIRHARRFTIASIELLLKKRNSATLVFTIQAIVLFGISPLQGDGHHDGIVFAPSVAFSEGLVVQKDVFSQYGPLNVWLYGSILKIFQNQVLVLRISAAFLSLFTAWLLYQVLNRTSLSKIALWITSVWTTANAVYMTSFPASPLPWASVTANLFALMGLLILVRKNKDDTQKKMLFLSGTLFGISIFARIQFVAFIPILILLVLSTKNLKMARSLALISSGFVSGLLFIVTVLYLQDALIPYFEQSVVFPLTRYPNLGFSTSYNLYLFTLVFTVPILALGLCFYLRKLLNHFNAFVVIFLTAGLFLSLNFAGRWLVPNSSFPLIPRVVFGEILEKSGLWLSYSSVLICLALPFVLLVNRRFRRDASGIKELGIIATGLIGVLQLYPYPDVQHLWWATPILLPALHFVPKLALTKEVLLLCKATILTGLMLFVYFLNQPWYEFKSHTMRGIYASKEKVELYEIYLPIEKFNDGRSYRFDCEDGIHSVAQGKYLSVDEWFVNWGNIQNESSLSPNVKAIFICDRKISYAQSQASKIGWTITFYNERSNSSGYRSLAILEPKSSSQP